MAANVQTSPLRLHRNDSPASQRVAQPQAPSTESPNLDPYRGLFLVPVKTLVTEEPAPVASRGFFARIWLRIRSFLLGEGTGAAAQ